MAQNKYTGINRLFQSHAIQSLRNALDDGTFSEFFSDWKWIFTYSKRYRWVILLYTLLGIFSSSLSLAASYVGRILINIIVGKQFGNLWVLIVTMLLTTVISLTFSSVTSRLSAKISVYVNNDIQADIFDRIIDAQWVELSRYPGGDILNRFNGDVNTVASNAIGWIPNLVINLYTFTVTFVVLFRLDVIMALIAVLAAPFLLLMSRLILRKLREYRKRVLELNSQMMSFEMETFTNFDMIKSFGILKHYSDSLRNWQKQYKKYNLDYNKFEIKSKIMMTLVSTLVSFVAFGYCLYRLWTGQILYGDMTFFLQQRDSLTNRFNALVNTFPNMMNSAVSAHRIRELVELEKEVHDADSLEKLSRIADQGISVEVKNATFSYQEGATVYNGCDFSAHPGQIVAILGASGEGKTTILRMILGLLHPEEGSVILRGADGEAVPINADLRQLFSYVPQGNTILSGTIAENMRMVKEDASDAEIIQVLKTACAWEFVEKLPDGINSKLGDNGRGISMGQAQRLSIARALLRNSPILVLDEATSALDVGTEKRVLHNIIQQRPNKTCIVSTHRTGVLKQCQKIYSIFGQNMVELDIKSEQDYLKLYAEEL